MLNVNSCRNLMLFTIFKAWNAGGGWGVEFSAGVLLLWDDTYGQFMLFSHFKNIFCVFSSIYKFQIIVVDLILGLFVCYVVYAD